MEINHNEIEEILLYPSNSRDQNYLSKPKLCAQNNNDENKVKEKVNHETTEKQNNDFGLNKSLFKNFEKSLLNFLEYSTIGGLSEIGRRKDLHLRLFWMIAVFICSSYALVTFIEKVKVYYKYETNLLFDRYQDMPTKFPAITICNENQFNEQYAFKFLKDKFNFYNDYGIYNDEEENIFLFDLLQYFYSERVNSKTVNQLKRTLFNDLNQTELSNIGYNLDSEMLISCQYNENLCSETNGDFKRFWNNIYGNCYTFNGGNNSYLIGNHHGLHLEMIVSKYKKQFKIFDYIFKIFTIFVYCKFTKV
jgi:hypothetical protein